MGWARRRLVLAFALLAFLAATSPTAMGHADLLSAEPAANSRVDEAPDELTLDFSEPLEDTYTRVRLLDTNDSDHVESFRIPTDHRDHLVAKLAPLDDGVYSVQWRALSAADGHTTSGSYLLGVNASLSGPQADMPGGGPTQPSATGQEPTTQVGEGGPGEALLRGVGFFGASLAVGIPLFLLMAHGINVPETVRRRWWGASFAGAGIATVATLGLAGSLASRIEVPISLALGTTPGQNLALRIGLFALAGLLLYAGARARGTEHGAALAASGAVAASAGLVVTSLGSHAAAGGIGSGVSIAVDWVHQAAVAFWVAGVAALVIAALSDTAAGALAELIRRFSPLAVASVALIVLTGVIASVDRLTSLGDLVGSLYGFALSAKILLIVPLLALGAYHRYRLLPQLETPGNEAVENGRLRNSAVLELGVMVVVLLAAGMMTTTSPPTPAADLAPYSTFEDARQAQGPGPFSPDLDESRLETIDEAEAENYTLKLLEPARIDELRQGGQPVWLLLSDENGDQARPVTDAEVHIEAWMPLHGHGTQPETDPLHVHEGMYEGATHWLMPGAWQLRFDVTLPEGDRLHYNLTVYVEQKADPLDRLEPAHTFTEDGFRLEVYLTPQPVEIGVQNMSVRVTPDKGVFPENADVVANLESPSSSGGEGQSLDLERWREDAWTREGAIFTERGEWEVLVALQGKDTYTQTTFTLDVG